MREIPPTAITLDSTNSPGSIRFVSVVKGTFNGLEVVLKKPTASSPEALRSFEREAQLLARVCHHPCIPQLLGMCRMSEAQVYMVMEDAGVCNLEKALCEPQEKPLLGVEWEEYGVLLGLLMDVASALRHMHERDPAIVHNDVALRNVVVRRENGRNRAKLIDMALAHIVPRSHVHQLANGTRMPRWQLAPETLRSRVVSPASDVFQFGNLIYEMLARQRPFWRAWTRPAARGAVVESIKTGKRPSREDVPAAGAYCDDALWQLAEECWRDDPLLRPSMVQVSARLVGLIRERGGVPREQVPLGQRFAVTEGLHYVELAPQPGPDDDSGDDDGDSRDDDEEAKAEDEECTSTVSAHAPGLLGAFCVSRPPVPRTGAVLAASPALSATLAAVYAAVNATSPERSSSPAHVSEWTVDDVCAWLLELGTPACVELVPLFRHHGVDGAVLMMLDGTELAEVGVPRLTSLVLLRARDKLLSSL